MKNNQKEKWDKLATKNPMYYIYSSYGKQITEKEFNESGIVDYKKYIKDDLNLNMKLGDFSKLVVLDFGCGAGRILKPMANDFKTVIGADLSEEMIKLAQTRMIANRNVFFLELDDSTIKIKDKAIDFVFSYTVFQHIKSLDELMKIMINIHFIMKPGGVFKFNMVTPRSTEEYMEIEEEKKWWGGIRLSHKAIEDMVKTVGFKDFNIDYIDNRSYWVKVEK